MSGDMLMRMSRGCQDCRQGGHQRRCLVGYLKRRKMMIIRTSRIRRTGRMVRRPTKLRMRRMMMKMLIIAMATIRLRGRRWRWTMRKIMRKTRRLTIRRLIWMRKGG
jgi:hypothetical protein